MAGIKNFPNLKVGDVIKFKKGPHPCLDIFLILNKSIMTEDEFSEYRFRVTRMSSRCVYHEILVGDQGNLEDLQSFHEIYYEKVPEYIDIGDLSI